LKGFGLTDVMVQDDKTTYLIPDVDTLWRGGLGSFAVTASAIAHQDKATQAAIRGSSERTATAYKPPAGLKLPVAFKIGAPRISITCCWGGSTAGPSHYRTYVARVVWFGFANAEDKTKTARSPTRPKRVGLSCGSFSQVFQRTGAFASSNLVVTANSAIFRPMSAPASVEKR